MKQLLIIAVMALTATAFASCEKEIDYPAPPALEHPVTVPARPGAIIPENPGQKEHREFERRKR